MLILISSQKFIIFTLFQNFNLIVKSVEFNLEIKFYCEICGMYYRTLVLFLRYLKIHIDIYGVRVSLNAQKISKLRRAQQSRVRFLNKILNDTKISAKYLHLLWKRGHAQQDEYERKEGKQETDYEQNCHLTFLKQFRPVLAN